MSAAIQYPDNGSYALGDVELRPSDRLISCAGKEKKVSEMMYRLADKFLSSGNAIVSHDALIDVMWPEAEHIPENITRASHKNILSFRTLLSHLEIPYALKSYRKLGFRLVSTTRPDRPAGKSLTFNGVNFNQDLNELSYQFSRAMLPSQVARMAEPLFRSPGSLVPYERLFGRLWPDSRQMPETPSDSLKVFVQRLRQALKQLDAPVTIVRVRGEGLKLIGRLPRPIDPSRTALHLQ